MEKLVNMVSERAGVPPDKARTAVEVVLGFLKDRLPAPIAGQIDGVVSGGDAEGEGGGIAGQIGGALGGGS